MRELKNVDDTPTSDVDERVGWENKLLSEYLKARIKKFELMLFEVRMTAIGFIGLHFLVASFHGPDHPGSSLVFIMLWSMSIFYWAFVYVAAQFDLLLLRLPDRDSDFFNRNADRWIDARKFEYERYTERMLSRRTRMTIMLVLVALVVNVMLTFANLLYSRYSS